MIDVVQLAASGYGLPGIARALDVDEPTAARMLLDALSDATESTLSREQARAVEVAHLDLLRRSMTPMALQGDIAATRMLIRIHSARVLLLDLAEHEPPADDAEEVSELDRIRDRRDARRAPAG